jgi:nitrogen fixation protein FixH
MREQFFKTAGRLVYAALVAFYGAFIAVGLVVLWQGLFGPG